MELDFKTVKALSSPTRVNILRQVLGKESTPTELSDELNKSKSTVSSHLQTLTDAELLEKDKVEGRKRVTYRPTRKAEAIVEGRERKVKFSIASTTLTSFAGVALFGYGAIQKFGVMTTTAGGGIKESAQLRNSDMAAQGGDSGGMGVMSKGADSATSAASNVTDNAAQAPNEALSLLSSGDPFLYMGAGLLGIAALSLVYGLIMRKLG